MPTVTGKSQSCFAKMNNLFICQHASWKLKYVEVCRQASSLFVQQDASSLPTCRETWDKSGRVVLRNVEALNWLTHKIHWCILIWWFFSHSMIIKWLFFWNIFTPVTHHFIFFRSVDGILNPTIKNSHVPKWNYVLLRFQVN